jgi:hypothetical protein
VCACLLGRLLLWRVVAEEERGGGARVFKGGNKSGG